MSAPRSGRGRQGGAEDGAPGCLVTLGLGTRGDSHMGSAGHIKIRASHSATLLVYKLGENQV